MTLSNDDRLLIRRALWSWAGYARSRANEIAQDRHNWLGLPTSAVGKALDEAAHAERLYQLFREGDAQ